MLRREWGKQASRISAIVFAGLAAATSTLTAQVKTLTFAPEIRIDGEKEDLTPISSVRMNSRGDIAFTQRQDAQFRIYDANGQRVSTFGRRGSGPGEFQPRAFDVRGWIGDTVWVIDGTLRRLTYITRDGKLVRTEAQPQARTGTNEPIAIFTPNSRSRNGTWLGVRPINDGEGSFLYTFVAVTPSDSRVIGAIVEDSTYKWEFAPGWTVGFSQDGEQVAYATPISLVRRGGKFRVHLLRANGETVFNREYGYTGVPLSKQRVDSILARGVGPKQLRTLPSKEIPPVLSPLDGLMLAEDGRIWITIRESETARSAMVLDQRGVIVAKALLPPRSRIMAADGARIWLKVEDEDGAESLVRYRLVEGQK